MGEKTAIEWTDSSWTPIRARNKATGKVGWHCAHVTPGCENCYSESLNKRLGTGLPFKPGHEKDIELFLDEKLLTDPLRWKKPKRIFVCSMTDLFADFVPDAWIDRVFAVMALAPQHTFQCLTKRAKRMREYCSDPTTPGRIYGAMADLPDAEKRGIKEIKAAYDGLMNWPLKNVHLGVSAEDQSRADERIPDLLATPAAVRFVSAEPLLGPIDFDDIPWPVDRAKFPETDDISDGRSALRLIGGTRLDWIIVGGESGKGARPMHPAWARSIRDQCKAAGVPFFFKQWGEWVAGENDRAVKKCAVWQNGMALSGLPRNADQNYLVWHENGVPRFGDQRKYPHGRIEAFAQRVGKRVSGRLLDGVEHNEMPA